MRGYILGNGLPELFRWFAVPFRNQPLSVGKFVNICSGFISLKFGAIDVSGLKLNFSEEMFHWYCYFFSNDALVDSRDSFDYNEPSDHTYLRTPLQVCHHLHIMQLVLSQTLFTRCPTCLVYITPFFVWGSHADEHYSNICIAGRWCFEPYGLTGVLYAVCLSPMSGFYCSTLHIQVVCYPSLLSHRCGLTITVFTEWHFQGWQEFCMQFV